MSRRAAKIRRNAFIEGENGQVIVKSTNRRVRVTVKTTIDAKGNIPIKATLAFVDLDEAAVQKLILRLERTKGGKVANKPKVPITPPTPVLRPPVRVRNSEKRDRRSKPHYQALEDANKAAAVIVEGVVRDRRAEKRRLDDRSREAANMNRRDPWQDFER